MEIWLVQVLQRWFKIRHQIYGLSKYFCRYQLLSYVVYPQGLTQVFSRKPDVLDGKTWNMLEILRLI
jgi:hypothetical protein